jgi:calcineurin-like phosphoesterase family protein
MIFFTSDHHFFHKRIINQYGRHFNNVEQMNNCLIENWNNCVRADDEVYILGDFLADADGTAANKILNKLKGIKYLIRGNHDKYLEDPSFDANNYKWVKDYFEINNMGKKIILFHYPIFEWNNFFRNSIHLFGHIHNTQVYEKQTERFTALDKRAINVGVDLHNYTPVSINTILKMIDEDMPSSLHLPEKRNVFHVQKSDNNFVWHLTNINNLPTILEYGLLSRTLLKEKKHIFIDNSPDDLTQKRSNLGFDDYVPFHFFPLNPYDIFEFQRNKNREEIFCYLTLKDEEVKKLNGKVVFGYANHKPEVEFVDFSRNKKKVDEIRKHTDYNVRKDKIEALGECLIKDKVSPENFYSIVIGSESHRDIIEEFAEIYLPKGILIEVKPGYFNRWFERIFYRRKESES